MTRISIELVPRNEAILNQELHLVRDHYPAIDTVNIPDLLKFELRSLQASQLAAPLFPFVIPHLRAIDFDLSQPLKLGEKLREAEIEEVLVIAGDQPRDMSQPVFRTTSLDLIRHLRKECPDLKIYAGLDQYRSGFRTELDYAKQKLDAGASGFFTQPFFDLRLLAIYHELLEGREVFYGVSPVLNDKSRMYWESINNAFFPPDFTPTLEWNRKFAKQTFKFCQQNHTNIYFMPIRIDLRTYLHGIIKEDVNPLLEIKEA